MSAVGLTVRWSLAGAADGVEQALRDYVRDESVARFTGMAGLVEKRWQVVPGESFAGVYVWASAADRAAFLERFRGAPSTVTDLVGAGPESITEWDLVGAATGANGPLV